MKLARPLIESFHRVAIRVGTEAGLAVGLSGEHVWTAL